MSAPWCDFLTVEEVSTDFWSELKFNADPAKRAPELFGAQMYRMDMKVSDSTLAFTVKVHRQTMRRFLAKKRSLESALGTVCCCCNKSNTERMYVSCVSRQCRLCYCATCLIVDSNCVCSCLGLRTFEWWTAYDFVLSPWVGLELYGEDGPPALLLLAAAKVRSSQPGVELDESEVPAQLLPLMNERAEDLAYWTEIEFS